MGLPPMGSSCSNPTSQQPELPMFTFSVPSNVMNYRDLSSFVGKTTRSRRSSQGNTEKENISSFSNTTFNSASKRKHSVEDRNNDEWFEELHPNHYKLEPTATTKRHSTSTSGRLSTGGGGSSIASATAAAKKRKSSIMMNPPSQSQSQSKPLTEPPQQSATKATKKSTTTTTTTTSTTTKTTKAKKGKKRDEEAEERELAALLLAHNQKAAADKRKNTSANKREGREFVKASGSSGSGRGTKISNNNSKSEEDFDDLKDLLANHNKNLLKKKVAVKLLSSDVRCWEKSESAAGRKFASLRGKEREIAEGEIIELSKALHQNAGVF